MHNHPGELAWNKKKISLTSLSSLSWSANKLRYTIGAIGAIRILKNINILRSLSSLLFTAI